MFCKLCRHAMAFAVIRQLRTHRRALCRRSRRRAAAIPTLTPLDTDGYHDGRPLAGHGAHYLFQHPAGNPSSSSGSVLEPQGESADPELRDGFVRNPERNLTRESAGARGRSVWRGWSNLSRSRGRARVGFPPAGIPARNPAPHTWPQIFHIYIIEVPPPAARRAASTARRTHAPRSRDT